MGNYASNNLSPFSGDNTEHFAENQRKLAQLLNIDPKNIIIPYQNHGTEIREINAHYQKLSTAEKYEYLNGIDALFTQIQDICIGITTADCVPIIFYDPIKKQLLQSMQVGVEPATELPRKQFGL